ncbi:MAG TPA: hypothetical protein VN282_22390 [Pyrinomonadaceae bacterium]|nr:hypothetical protein [Pyrinomonadaceae bacterium]
MSDTGRDHRPAFARTFALTLAAVLLGGQSSAGACAQSAEGSEVKALLLEVARNERAMGARRLEYTWTLKVTDREPGKGGDVKRQSVNVYEVYPVRGEFARKLVSRDGVPVSRERAEKELKQTAERLEKATREEQKRTEGKAPPPPPQPPPDPVVVFEHERVSEAVWLERFVHINTYARKDLFNGIKLDTAKESSDFQRFTARTGEEKLDEPKRDGESPPQP